MKRSAYILLLAILFVTLKGNDVWAYTINETEETQNVVKKKTERYISYLYSKLKFSKNEKLSFEAFRPAVYGYLNMLQSGKISADKLLTICDFTLSSNKKRMWVLDIKNKKVLFHTLVSHGMGSGEEFAEKFSNTPDSHQSSQGFYLTRETYTGNNGHSLKLEGVDGAFNSNAYDRAIVIHPADYCTPQFAADHKRLGRSHGCPALPPDVAPQIIEKIKNGSCLFIYHRSNNYLSRSRWLTTPLTRLPSEAEMMDLNLPDNERALAYAREENPSNAAGDTPLRKISANDIDLKERKVSSVIVIHEDSRSGTSDTTVVK